jgi:putative solute:sodium symporter small subunit
MTQNDDQSPLYSPYWNAVKQLTWKVLTFWVVSILAAVLLSPMIKMQVFGIPLAYWLISGVLLLSFLGAVAYFAWQMDRLEEQNVDSPTHSQASASDS